MADMGVERDPMPSESSGDAEQIVDRRTDGPTATTSTTADTSAHSPQIPAPRARRLDAGTQRAGDLHDAEARLPEQRPPAEYRAEARAPSAAAPSAESHDADGLSPRDRAVLAFEKAMWRSRAAKDRAIRERFDVSSARYYQVLNALLDNPLALAAEAELVSRLRRERTERRAARSPRHADTGRDA